MKAVCPKCGFAFDAKRNKKGAGYALAQEHLTDKQTKLLSWWLGSPYVKEAMTKDQISNRYRGTTLGGIVARIPELYALDLLTRFDNGKAHGGVTYKLNFERVVQVLNRNGRLK